MYTTDYSLIDDARLLVADDEVSFTVQASDDQTDIYSMPTDEYSAQLDQEQYPIVNQH